MDVWEPHLNGTPKNKDFIGKSYVVQAADLLAGTIRRKTLDHIDAIKDELSKFADFTIILP